MKTENVHGKSFNSKSFNHEGEMQMFMKNYAGVHEESCEGVQEGECEGVYEGEC